MLQNVQDLSAPRDSRIVCARFLSERSDRWHNGRHQPRREAQRRGVGCMQCWAAIAKGETLVHLSRYLTSKMLLLKTSFFHLTLQRTGYTARNIVASLASRGQR